ncbi:pyruvate kinase [Entomoplasma ellychniae]|uniref:Pyruvate kinase n=2 Tax=Entomoplasmataceae TaxID=33925 RepID=A0A2S5RGT0_9MOLU|nr:MULTISPECIES: pyruvate kinase [Entomoplasmataceae]PPE04968.1 pyruvate kinase [Entomoplasma ellychniae]PPE06501.1 pyruvate kinase [Mesoplasma corruscae]
MTKKEIQERIKRTKIITTTGPATNEPEQIKELFLKGMTTIRLNFSHGDNAEQKYRIDGARKVAAELNKPISILLDTKGPEIRVGKFLGGKQEIKAGQKIIIKTDPESFRTKECGQGEMTVAYDMSVDLKVGNTILIDDGKLELTVDKVSPGVVEATAFNRHLVKTNKRVNLPGVEFSMPFLAEKDVADIKYGVEQKVDYIAASFVNTAENVKEIKNILAAAGGSEIQIISKIESQVGIDNIDAIIQESDGIMVARGDLGLEIPYYDVPYWEKVIIRKCREAGKIVIVATQMLETMTDNPAPTRAEVTDVYFATELGADATMLSGESAAGSYPAITVETMATINKRAEIEFYKKGYYQEQLESAIKSSKGPRADIAVDLAERTRDGQYEFAIVLSRTGALLKTISKFRPNVAILGVSESERLLTAFGAWHSIFMSKTNDLTALEENDVELSKIALHWGAKSGQKILIVRNKDIRETIVK